MTLNVLQHSTFSCHPLLFGEFCTNLKSEKFLSGRIEDPGLRTCINLHGAHSTFPNHTVSHHMTVYLAFSFCRPCFMRFSVAAHSFRRSYAHQYSLQLM